MEVRCNRLHHIHKSFTCHRPYLSGWRICWYFLYSMCWLHCPVSLLEPSKMSRRMKMMETPLCSFLIMQMLSVQCQVQDKSRWNADIPLGMSFHTGGCTRTCGGARNRFRLAHTSRNVLLVGRYELASISHWLSQHRYSCTIITALELNHKRFCQISSVEDPVIPFCWLAKRNCHNRRL